MYIYICNIIYNINHGWFLSHRCVRVCVCVCVCVCACVCVYKSTGRKATQSLPQDGVGLFCLYNRSLLTSNPPPPPGRCACPAAVPPLNKKKRENIVESQ
jgi:hypothetical protein